GLRKEFGSLVAVEDLDLNIGHNEFVSLLGPSGCGKTTTLRMVAAFVTPTAGGVYINGRLMNDVPPYARNCGMVFQNYALFPHLKAWDNVAYGLKVRKGIPKDEITRRMETTFDLVRMTGWETHYPKQLSGGQQQRIALARALIIEPSVLLLDEPLSNLDAKLRAEMRSEIRTLVKSLGITTMFVTHDQEEAMVMADRIVVMNQGRVEQIGTAEDIYERPETVFVATFVGTTNLFHDAEVAGSAGNGRYAVTTDDGLRLEGMRKAGQGAPTGTVALSIRPERIDIARSDQADASWDSSSPYSLTGKVAFKEYIGPVIRYRVAVGNADRVILVDQQNRDVSELGVDDEARFHWSPQSALIVAADASPPPSAEE
ncbi:MAG: ABC transporter ATP-binding protein, partial [Dehalococcoidia bacterium]|nr:ABC transporter ATP-binding protein [Dehalococcoidia bacterium]